MTTSAERIPILIVAGFLGAGKTTFIRELLPRLVGGSRAPYVILNDFLNAMIDAHTLRGLGAEIKTLAAGCVCCEDPSSLVRAILDVSASIRPLLIIEANGATDPYALIETITLAPDLRDIVGPVLQVTIINEARWGKRRLPGDKHNEKAQVRTASVILTNRGERATDIQLQHFRNDLQQLNPTAPVLDMDSLVQILLTGIALDTLLAPNPSDPIPHQHLHVAVQLAPPTMSEECLRQWLISLPSEVLRVKGLVRLSDTEMAYFNRTDDPFETPRIIKIDAEAGMEPAVVFIGPGLSEESLRASFHQKTEAAAFRLF